MKNKTFGMKINKRHKYKYDAAMPKRKRMSQRRLKLTFSRMGSNLRLWKASNALNAPRMSDKYSKSSSKDVDWLLISQIAIEDFYQPSNFAPVKVSQKL